MMDVIIYPLWDCVPSDLPVKSIDNLPALGQSLSNDSPMSMKQPVITWVNTPISTYNYGYKATQNQASGYFMGESAAVYRQTNDEYIRITCDAIYVKKGNCKLQGVVDKVVIFVWTYYGCV